MKSNQQTYANSLSNNTISFSVQKKSEKHKICVLEKVRNPEPTAGGKRGGRDKAENKAQSRNVFVSSKLNTKYLQHFITTAYQVGI